jgi:hypothetical protein
MQRRTGFRLSGGVAFIAAMAGAAVAPAAMAAPPTGPTPSPRTHGFMLYLSQPIGGGGGGSMRPKFGFRIEQIRMAGNSGAPDAGDPMQHRALVGWQMDGFHGIHASDMKVELGGRMTYDVTHSAFGMSRTYAASVSRPAATNRTDAAPASKPFSPRLFEPGPPAREPFRQTNESVSIAHEMAAAAIGSLRLTRPAATPQRIGAVPRPSSMREGN